MAVANGRLFTQTKERNQEIVLCLDVSTGKQIWSYRYDCDYTAHPTFTGGGAPQARTGPRATPAVDGDRLYALGATGILLCLDIKTGGRLWQQDLLRLGSRACPTQGYCASPMIAGNRVYVGVGGPSGKSLAALDKLDGRVVWQTLDDPLGYATPLWAEVGSKPQLIFFTAAAAVGVDPEDGKLLWRYPWQTRYNLHIATPIYADGKVFISSNYGTGAAVFRLNGSAQPETIWKSKSMQNHFSTSILLDGKLYGFSEGRLRCVDFETGNVQWDKDGLGKGSLLAVDGYLIILGENGELVLAKASPERYTELSRCQVFDTGTKTWTVPVLSDGRLFVRSENALIALDLAAASSRR
jgi:outer membrane protein assembly factor BamB